LLQRRARIAAREIPSEATFGSLAGCGKTLIASENHSPHDVESVGAAV